MATGRVRKRGNTWGYIINLPYDPKRGNYPTIRKSGFSSKDKAFQAMTKTIAEIDSGEAIFATMKVDAYLKEWLEQIKDKVSPRTWETYQHVAHTMSPFIGELRLDKLNHIAIETMYEKLKEKKLAASSIHRVHRVLRAALNRAVKRNIIRDTPMKRVDSPNGKIERRNVLSVEQSQLLLNWLEQHHKMSFLGATLALHTGMRRGEICGLEWRDIDWERKIIRITRSRQRRHRIDLIGDPKTAGSIRPIPVDDTVLHMLQIWYQSFPLEPVDTQFILAHFDGNPIDPMSLSRDIRRAVESLNLPKISFHDLRHTHATLLLQANVPLKIVSERLGHTSIAMTADTYSHVTETMQQDATQRISDLLQSKKFGTNSEHDEK